MDEKDWNLVLNVHLNGTYQCTAAAWPYFLAQKGGRILNTTSAAGLYGNFGQCNYSAAKLAIYGFTKTLAKEGERKEIFSNVIAPIAGSRMTETVMPAELVEALSPDYIAPFAAYLCSDSCKENGSLFELGGGFIAKVRWERSPGLLLNVEKHFNASAVLENFNSVVDFTKSLTYPNSMLETNWIELVEKSKLLPENRFGESGIEMRGNVVLITGAGAGLGKAYALEFAKEGAIVIINDVNKVAAEKVVNEIKNRFGGVAHAVCHSVLESQAIVDEVMKLVGRIDVLVNNAGILRDKSFAKMTEGEWKLVYEIHLLGTFRMTKAVWPIMLKQKYGRIINTSSAVGLYGNFGQANYSAAKAGILGFSNSIALEGKKHNIFLNTIAPNAGTAMTATIMEEKMVKLLLPDYVAPLVVLLGCKKCPCSGRIIEVGSGWQAAVRWQRSRGVFFDKSALKSVSKTGLSVIRNQWDATTGFTIGSEHPCNVNDALTKIMESLNQSSKSIDLEIEEKLAYTHKDVILYNSGLGCSVDIKDEFKYLYENHEKFAPIPTFAVIPCLNLLMGNVDFDKFLNNYNPALLLHGEHCLKLYGTLPNQSTLLSKARIIQLTEKPKKGVIVRMQVDSFDVQTHKKLFTNEAVIFIRNATPKSPLQLSEKSIFDNNSGSSSNLQIQKSNQSHSSPFTHASVVRIPRNLASIYRLSGDYNPLHIDPDVATAAGFHEPVLHGMCSFGICAKEIVKLFFNNDPTVVTQLQARFTQPVYPGQILTIRAKLLSSSTVEFQAFSNNNQLVITNGLCKAAVEQKQKL